MEQSIKLITECLKKGGDLCDTLNTIWLEQEAQGNDLSSMDLNALVLQAVKEMQ